MTMARKLSIICMAATAVNLVLWGVTLSKGFAACMALSACVGLVAEWCNSKSWREEEERYGQRDH